MVDRSVEEAKRVANALVKSLLDAMEEGTEEAVNRSIKDVQLQLSPAGKVPLTGADAAFNGNVAYQLAMRIAHAGKNFPGFREQLLRDMRNLP